MNSSLNKYLGILVLSIIMLCSCRKNPVEIENPITEKTPLLLKASSNQIEEGEEVIFEITAEGKIIEAEIYINNTKINGLKHLFNTKGAYQVIAKKEGYLESKVLDIIVKEAAYEVNVYAVGYEYNAKGEVPKYWKNGTSVELGTKRGMAYSIFVNETDVYAGGYTVSNMGYRNATVWKNNMEEHWYEGKQNQPGIILSVYAYKGDLYAAGRIDKAYLESVAGYWKNGAYQEIGTKEQAYKGESISVDEKGTHIVGSCNENGVSAFYWNNNQLQILSNSYQGFSVFTHNGDVFMTGRAAPPRVAPTYWKNGAAHTLSGNELSETVIATGIYSNGKDIYVSGWRINEKNKFVGVYWKNGEMQDITDGKQNAKINGVFVFEGDVYLTGYESNGVRDIAKYWKNGVASNLTDGQYHATAFQIAVVKQRK